MEPKPASGEPTLSVKDLSIGLASLRGLVSNVSFDIGPNRVLALVGESGSGKTLVNRSVLGLLPESIRITGGSIRYRGTDTTNLPLEEMRQLRGREIGMVFQEPLVSLNPAMAIGEQIAEGMQLHLKLRSDEIRGRSIEMLRRIQIADPEGCLAAYPHQFSGGMRQRIMLASVMLLKPKLLIADEPTTALDSLSQLQVMETMMELTRENGTAVLLVTHNLGLVSRYAEDVVVLEKGEVVERGLAADVIASPTHPYTQKLVSSLPRRSRQVRRQPTGEPVLEARDIELSFSGKVSLLTRAPRKKVLNGVSLAVRRGETVAVVGGSGSGKTTLGRAMLRLIDIDAGAILHKGEEISRLPDRALRSFRRSCQIVFQDPFSSLDPRMRVGSLVGEALRHDRSLSARQRREKAEKALADVGLPDYAERLPHELSGGQRQRVAIARAVVGEPDLVVADEPISALDMTVQKQVLELFETLQKERGFACIFISHDLSAVHQIAHRIVVMHDGRIVEEGDCEMIFAAPQHEYTRRLLAASPAIDVAERTRRAMEAGDG